jgi:tetratricopeptide (TPR) repeat protein
MIGALLSSCAFCFLLATCGNGIATAPAPYLSDPAPFQAGESLAVARREFDRGRYQEAVRLLQAALDPNPNDPAISFWLARAYFELEEFDRAIEHAERAVERSAADSEYHRWLGRAYGEKADRTRSFSLARKTRDQFEEAVRLDGKNLEARRDLMDYYLEAPRLLGGGKDKARSQAEAIAAIDVAAGHAALARYWAHENQRARADAEYRALLDLKPSRIDPLLEAADYYADHLDAAAMEAAIEAAARVDASDLRLTYYRGVAAVLTAQHPSEAEQLLRTYLTSVPTRSDRPSHAAAHVWLGCLYERLGKADAAASEYRAALKLEPGRKPAREGLRRVSHQ